MKALGRLLAALALLAALPVCASELTLIAPRAGATLQGGRIATVEWRGSDLPAEASEWEAFLSIDGGASWSYRVTPHLELARHRFTFEVPNVATEDARILLRVGDERREVEFVVPASFRIEPDRLLAVTAPRVVLVDEERGEAARAGVRGVVSWVEGDRHGAHVQVRSAWKRLPVLHGSAPALRDDSSFEAAVSSPLPLASRRVETFVACDAPLSRLQPVLLESTGRDVLLVSSRLNI